jgi:hypothetical protein
MINNKKRKIKVWDKKVWEIKKKSMGTNRYWLPNPPPPFFPHLPRYKLISFTRVLNKD